MQLIDLIKNPENKQKIMVGVFVAVVITTIFVLYNYYSGEKAIVDISGDVPVTSFFPMAGIKLDTGILENPIFQNLKKMGNYPIESKEEEFGRMNPFSPY